MIALVSGLLALAGLFAERSVAIARRAALAKRLGPSTAPLRRHARVPRWGVVGACGIAVLFALGPSWAIVAVAAAFAGDRILRRRRGRATARRREEQLADTVAAVAAGLRAGLSLSGSLAYARDEAEPPMREDLARLVDRVHVGVPIVVALGEWADQLGSEDARLLVGVLDLHRHSGGDLPSVLDGVVATLRDRRAAHREVRALTAQARLSGLILGTLPIGFFGFLLLTSRHEMLDAIATPLGRTAVGLGLALELGAFLWIRRLLEVR
jgi:tight adherence protein B